MPISYLNFSESLDIGKLFKLYHTFDLQQHLDVSSFLAANSLENAKIAEIHKRNGSSVKKCECRGLPRYSRSHMITK
jgi:hypothetical protein